MKDEAKNSGTSLGSFSHFVCSNFSDQKLATLLRHLTLAVGNTSLRIVCPIFFMTPVH